VCAWDGKRRVLGWHGRVDDEVARRTRCDKLRARYIVPLRKEDPPLDRKKGAETLG